VREIKILIEVSDSISVAAALIDCGQSRYNCDIPRTIRNGSGRPVINQPFILRNKRKLQKTFLTYNNYNIHGLHVSAYTCLPTISTTSAIERTSSRERRKRKDEKKNETDSRTNTVANYIDTSLLREAAVYHVYIFINVCIIKYIRDKICNCYSAFTRCESAVANKENLFVRIARRRNSRNPTRQGRDVIIIDCDEIRCSHKSANDTG